MGVRRFAVLWAALAVAALGAMPSAAQPAKSQWAQTGSDLAADPAITFGVLPNGMRYAIQKNNTPAEQTAIRLLINAGSMQEAPDQYGLAHFLEHMAFRGSTHVADGDVMKSLERLGAARGADTNASTGPSRTTFMFNLPRSDEESIDTGLMLMRETASELKLDPVIMKTEAGVVLSEERLRDGPAYRAGQERLKFFWGDHPYVRSAIGETKVVEAASSPRVRAYYNAYYRPERATLVVVGNVDPKAIETKIKARFSDWRGKGAAGGDPAPAKFVPRTADLKIAIAPGQANLVMFWPRPYVERPETRAEAIRTQLRSVAYNVLGRRITERNAAEGRPFLGAGLSMSRIRDVGEGVQMAVLGVTDWQKAMKIGLATQKQTLQYGVTQQEVDLVINTLRANMKAITTAASTRQSVALAEGIVSASANDGVVVSPALRQEIFEEAVRDLKADKVNAVLREDLSGTEPVAFLQAPTMPPEGEAAARAAFVAAVRAPVEAYVAPEIKAWPYTNFGAPGKVVERRTDEPNLTMIRFENGVRLTIKPSDVQKNVVEVNVLFGHGKLDLPRDRINASQLVDTVFIAGGLKDLSVDEIRRTLDGKIVGRRLSTNDEAFRLIGATTPNDFGLQMQVLAAYLTAPGWRSDTFPQTLTAIAEGLAAIDTNASAVASSRTTELLHVGDARWRLTTKEEVTNTTMNDVRAFFEPILNKGPVEVIVVGDVTVDQAIEAVAKTFGAIAPRAPFPEPPGARIVKFPAPTPKPIEVHHKGRADQGVAIVAWPAAGLDFTKPDNFFAGNVLKQILQARLTERIRETEGKTYSPSVTSDFSHSLTGYGYFLISTEVPKEKMDSVYASIDSIVDDIAANGVTADEFSRVMKPILERARVGMTQNGFWSLYLARAQTDPTVLPYFRAIPANYEKVTPAAVQAEAKKWLRKDTAWRLMVTPEPPASGAGAGQR